MISVIIFDILLPALHLYLDSSLGKLSNTCLTMLVMPCFFHNKYLGKMICCWFLIQGWGHVSESFPKCINSSNLVMCFMLLLHLLLWSPQEHSVCKNKCRLWLSFPLFLEFINQALAMACQDGEFSESRGKGWKTFLYWCVFCVFFPISTIIWHAYHLYKGEKHFKRWK